VPAIQRLLAYYKGLPEFSDRQWSERRARILGEDFPAFHSTLVEISLHEALSAISGLSSRFIDPEQGGRRRADYELRFGGTTIEAELKSILSEQVSLAEGTASVGIRIDPATARSVWRKFTQPIREGQVDMDRPAAVFVDITFCHELYVFMALSHAIRSSELHDHAQSLLDQLLAARRAAVSASTLLVVCGFEPNTYRALFIAPVPHESGASKQGAKKRGQTPFSP